MNLSMHVRHSRKARMAAALVSLAALAACGQQPAGDSGAAGTAAPTTRFTENGVTVTLSVSDWHASKGTVTAVFTPERKGFHLYSIDLPATGIEDVGRPTAMAVSGSSRRRAG